MSMTIQSSVKDKILATSSETSKVENAPAEMLRDLDQQMEKRADDGKANVVTDALSRKERVKPRRVRAICLYDHIIMRLERNDIFGSLNLMASALYSLSSKLKDTISGLTHQGVFSAWILQLVSDEVPSGVTEEAVDEILVQPPEPELRRSNRRMTPSSMYQYYKVVDCFGINSQSDYSSDGCEDNILEW
ncbi:hypothetical protein Tco_0813558 [Tanacetum coccineum]